jgi:hypothetical protein
VAAGALRHDQPCGFGEGELVYDAPLWLWTIFATILVVGLAVDLLAHRQAHAIGFKEAAVWSAVWVGLALAFAVVIFLVVGTNAGVQYTTAWLLEKSLSVDNLFVIALVFGYFQVPHAYQHRVLFFGVLGALVFRGLFLAAGVAAVSRFTAVLFVFGAFLFYSAYKILNQEQAGIDPGESLAVRLLRKVIPVRDDYSQNRFFLREAGKLAARRRRRGRGRRPGLRRRQRARRPGGQQRPVHRLHQQRLRDPRSARPVLPARWPAGPLPLPRQGLGAHSRLHRRQTGSAGIP